MLLAAAARRHAADELGAVGEALLGMERALLAGEALADDARVLVDEDGHRDGWTTGLLGDWLIGQKRRSALPDSAGRSSFSARSATQLALFRAAATTFFAASVRSLAAMIARPLSASSLRPCSAFVPSMRTTTGTLTPDVLHRVNDAFGDHVATDDAAENVHQDGAHVLVRQDQVERHRDALARRAAADVEEVGRRAAVQLDQVHRRHGEARRR